MAKNYGKYRMVTKDGAVFAETVRDLLQLMPDSEILFVAEYSYSRRKYRPNESALEWLCKERGQAIPEKPDRPRTSHVSASMTPAADACVEVEPAEIYVDAYGAYTDKHSSVIDAYLPFMGEGETMASQIVTAVHKLFYKWYNDIDVYDTTHLRGGYNDLSSYANWLDQHTTPEASEILNGVYSCNCAADYEQLLTQLADALLDEAYIETQKSVSKTGSIYECVGKYHCTTRDESLYND